MRQTRHRSAEVALGYLRPAELWRNNASQKVWDNASDEAIKSQSSKNPAVDHDVASQSSARSPSTR